MKKIVIVFAIIAAVSSELLPIEKLNDYLPLITGGSPSSPGQFPYQVGVVVMNQTNFEICSGVLIKHKWILTLASCLQMKFTNYMVAFGTNNLVDDDYPLIFNSTEASNLNIHPNYNSVTNVNNIALIKLDYMPANITDHKNIDYLEIPSADEAKTNLTGRDIVISGYGLTRDVPELDLILHHTTVRLAPNDVCKNFEFDLGGRYNVTDSTLCIDTTGGKSPCMDGGGPMTTEIESKKVLVGIIGFGTFPCTIGNPATGESVFYHREWIEKTSGSSEVVVSFSIFALVVMMAVKNLF